jgi:hypothetical protein
MIKTLIVSSLSICMAFLNPSISYASLMTVRDVTHRGGTLSQQMATELEKPEAQARLAKYGISPAEARQRIAALSDQEIKDLMNSRTSAQAGGDIIIGLTTILLIVIIILLIRH